MGHTRAEAIRIASEFLADAAKRHRIRRAFLFGSLVWGQPAEYSDIDLALVLEPSAGEEKPPYTEAFEIFHAAQEFNSALEVVCFSAHDFDVNGGSLVRRIKEAGLELPVNSQSEFPRSHS